MRSGRAGEADIEDRLAGYPLLDALRGLRRLQVLPGKGHPARRRFVHRLEGRSGGAGAHRLDEEFYENFYKPEMVTSAQGYRWDGEQS